MKRILLSFGLLLGLTVNAQDCSELFISEYVEGWSNNKALEIYNPTNQAIDLSDYVVIRYSNGANFVTAEAAVALNGTIEPYSTYVAVLDKRDPNGTGQEAEIWSELQEKADGFYCPVYDISKAMYFNGNDAVVLAKGSLQDVDDGEAMAVDIFGKIGEDPDYDKDAGYFGWTSEFPHVGPGEITGEGVDVTTDHSLIRKPNIKKGVTINPVHFDPLAEWDSIPPVLPRLDENGNYIYNQQGNLVVDGNWESLGWHDCDCAPEDLGIDKESILGLSIYPNPSVDGEFKIDAKQNIIEIDVYSTVGQKILSERNLAGIQSINLGKNPGVYIINIKSEGNIVTSKRVIVK